MILWFLCHFQNFCYSSNHYMLCFAQVCWMMQLRSIILFFWSFCSPLFCCHVSLGAPHTGINAWYVLAFPLGKAWHCSMGWIAVEYLYNLVPSQMHLHLHPYCWGSASGLTGVQGAYNRLWPRLMLIEYHSAACRFGV